ncbi:hypothetical protein [Mesorhizobium sp. M0701]|uniref:hypothetical protein n=1 Tax=Mesorhizobium sp. M0701 TaxID=2956989 RepID=UPI003337AA53
MAANPVGTIEINVDGAWDIQDLFHLSESLTESYGYFLPLVAQDEDTRAQLHSIVQAQFWRGDIETRRFGLFLYRQIPKDDGLRIKSFHYSSPGTLILVGILPALLLAARVASKWLDVSEKLFDLYAKIEKYFLKRKNLVKPGRKTEVDDQMGFDLDEARVLLFQLSECLGFDEESTERICAIVGNPVSALKFMVAMCNEARKLSALEREGLLKLPRIGNDNIKVLPPVKALDGRQNTRSGVVVQTRKRRKVKKPGAA